MKKIVLLFIFIGTFLNVSAQVKIEEKSDTDIVMVWVWDSLQYYANKDFVPADFNKPDTTYYKEYKRAEKAWQKQLMEKLFTQEIWNALRNHIKTEREKYPLLMHVGFDGKGKIQYMLLLIDKELAKLCPDEEWISLYKNIMKEEVTLAAYYDFGREENNCAEIFILFNGQECEMISDSSGLENNKKYGQVEN